MNNFFAVLALLVLMAMPALGDDRGIQKDHLGGAYSKAHCSQMAGQLGYTHFQYGGYVGNIYYYNACFGVFYTNPPPPPGDCDNYTIETYSWALKMSSNQLRLRMLSSEFKAIYEPAFVLTERLAQSVGELEQSSKDGASCRFLTTLFFDEVRKDYDNLQSTFMNAHHQALDTKVGQSWLDVESDYRKLRSSLR